MREEKYLGFRANSEEQRKIQQLARLAGLETTSDVLRALVRHAEVKPVTLRQPVAVIEGGARQ